MFIIKKLALSCQECQLWLSSVETKNNTIL
jgi:hypothetical protein